MPYPWLILGVLLMSSHAHGETVTTTVRNGNSLATVTQSGDPATVTRKVEKRPGYTRIEQNSGNSRSVVVQSSNPADLPDMEDLEKNLPPEIRNMLKMLGK
jgi:hypothetical protein